MPSKLPRVRMVAVAGLAALSFGGIAAAAGLAPVAAERATQAAASTAGGQAAFAHGEAASLVHAPDAAAAANSRAASRSGFLGSRIWAVGQMPDHREEQRRREGCVPDGGAARTRRREASDRPAEMDRAQRRQGAPYTRRSKRPRRAPCIARR